MARWSFFLSFVLCACRVVLSAQSSVLTRDAHDDAGARPCSCAFRCRHDTRALTRRPVRLPQRMQVVSSLCHNALPQQRLEGGPPRDVALVVGAAHLTGGVLSSFDVFVPFE
jgi:hypothetical protein